MLRNENIYGTPYKHIEFIKDEISSYFIQLLSERILHRQEIKKLTSFIIDFTVLNLPN